MSEPQITNPIAAALCGAVGACKMMYLKDLDASSEELLATSPGGKARTPLAFTAEVAGFNFHVAKVLTDPSAKQLGDEERAAFYASITNKAAVIKALTDGTDALLGAIAALPVEDWGTEITAPWGAPVTKQALAGFAAQHMSYHDGQLNYVQTLSGDVEVHWM